MTNPRVVSNSNAGAVKKDEPQASINDIGEENSQALLVLEDLANSSFFSFSSLSLFLLLFFCLPLDFPACLPVPDPEFLLLLGDLDLDLDLDLFLDRSIDLDLDLLFPRIEKGKTPKYPGTITSGFVVPTVATFP